MARIIHCVSQPQPLTFLISLRRVQVEVPTDLQVGENKKTQTPCKKERMKSSKDDHRQNNLLA